MIFTISMGEQRFEIDLPKERAEELFRDCVGQCLGLSVQKETTQPQSSFKKIVPKTGQSSEDKGYKGFLHLECSQCKETKSFMPKTPIESYHCDKCDEYTELKDMCRVDFTCPNCGKVFKYQTNRLDADFSIDCINCGSPVDIRYNDKTKNYEGVFKYGR